MLPVGINLHESPILVFSAFGSACLVCQAHIIKSQAGFTSSKEQTMGEITAERWETLFFLIPPGKVHKDSLWL